MHDPARVLADMGLTLPAVPTPLGAYLPALPDGDLIHTSGMRKFSNIVLGEEAFKVTKTLHIFYNQRRVFRGAGKYLLKAMFLGSYDIEQKILPLRGDLPNHVVDILLAFGYTVAYCQCNMV